jgi:hypothetical protein
MQDEDRGFLYQGCYSVREGVSLAQQSAWGLHGSSRPVGTPREQTLHESLCRLWDEALHAALHPHGHLSVSLEPAPFSSRRPPALHRRIVEYANMPRPRCEPRLPLRCAVRARSLSPAPAWRRFHVRYKGLTISCIVARGRAFVAGTPPGGARARKSGGRADGVGTPELADGHGGRVGNGGGRLPGDVA